MIPMSAFIFLWFQTQLRVKQHSRRGDVSTGRGKKAPEERSYLGAPNLSLVGLGFSTMFGNQGFGGSEGVFGA